MVWPDLAAALAFLGVCLTINLAPGPDMVFVVAQTLAGDARQGRLAALGIGAGSLCQALLAAAGLSSLVAASPGVLTTLSWAGAAYLAWIGITTLRRPARFGVPPDPADPAAPPPLGRAEVFRRGVVTNLLNPKVILFYLTFLPQFTRPEAGPEWRQVLVLGTTFNALGTLVLLGVVEASGWIARQLQLEQRQRRAAALAKLPGVIFLGLAAHLAWP